MGSTRAPRGRRPQTQASMPGHVRTDAGAIRLPDPPVSYGPPNVDASTVARAARGRDGCANLGSRWGQPTTLAEGSRFDHNLRDSSGARDLQAEPVRDLSQHFCTPSRSRGSAASLPQSLADLDTEFAADVRGRLAAREVIDYGPASPISERMTVPTPAATIARRGGVTGPARGNEIGRAPVRA